MKEATMNAIAPNKSMPVFPPRIARLPLDMRGFPVPWFVAWIDGQPDFRVIRPGGIATAHNKGKCWICGETMGAHRVFVIGPMCSVNRVSSEPPSHYECAEFAAKACPFLTRPNMRRNEKDMPGEALQPAGKMICRNPGVVALWVSKGGYSLMRVDNGVLFNVGEPERVEWWAEGRPATRDEVIASVTSGYPLLMAEAMKEGPEAVGALGQAHAAAIRLFPAE